MKFWKETLLTTLVFLGISTSVLYTACEQDPCTNLNCSNGGTCLNGLCKCPTGYEGTECQINAADKFTGSYIGSVSCNAGLSNTDTVDIKVIAEPDTVSVYEHSNFTTYTGIAAGGNISINNVSSGSVTVTIANGRQLTLFVQQTAGGSSSTCTFVGSK
ncbi:MAG TPA: calcium-binding EGF-like domain-containing protein [Flavipsychrobacter sp.]|nr:calcium-binding EGF-like domain-containing protein [Flavipsychrobacter sp.]